MPSTRLTAYKPFTRELLERIRGCPARTPAECGCDLPECLRGKGNRWHLVTLDDCRTCLSRPPDPEKGPPS